MAVVCNAGKLAEFIASKYNDLNADVTFEFITDYGDEVEIKAHEALLSENAEFRADFGFYPERIQVRYASYEAFKSFLGHFYQRPMVVTRETLGDLVRLARMYEVDEVLALCEHFVAEHITVASVCSALQMAKLYKLPDVVDLCKGFIGLFAAYVFVTDDFVSCDRATLKTILTIETMQLDEEYVLDACVEWARNRCKQQGIRSHPAEWRYQLGSCLRMIRFPEMSPMGYTDRIDRYMGMYTNEEMRTLHLKVDPTLKSFRNSVPVEMGMMPKFMLMEQCT